HITTIFMIMIIRYIQQFILLYFLNSADSEKILEFIRTERAASYQSNYVDARYYTPVHNGDPMPKDAVRPFGRAMKFDGKSYDMAVALWIPDSDKIGVWGRAWEENGKIQAVFIHNHTVKTNNHPELAKGFRVLKYSGTPTTNGFRFSWVKVRDVDLGTVLYSGLNKHVPAVYVENDKYEFLGDSDWLNREMEYVVYGTSDSHTVANYGRYYIFDDEVYVLTKQRCSCAC
uniref:Uncharacterized protein n=2 Tax=Parascaris TaxID=6254 RepID=A0A915AWT1_PARUN